MAICKIIFYLCLAFVSTLSFGLNLEKFGLEQTDSLRSFPGEHFTGQIRLSYNKVYLEENRENTELAHIQSDLINEAAEGALSPGSIFLVPVKWKVTEHSLQSIRSTKMLPAKDLEELAKASITIWVSSDYLAIRKKNRSHFYVPLNLSGVKQIANYIDFELPTPLVVRRVHERSQLKLEPVFLPPGSKMTQLSYTLLHSERIHKQIDDNEVGLFQPKLISGHKKDVVISAKRNNQPGQLAIYGWIRKQRPVQPLSLYHHREYLDYSHGIRFVWPYLKIGESYYSYRKLLEHPFLSYLLSDHGRISSWQFVKNGDQSG